MRSEAWARARIGVREAVARQKLAGRADIVRISSQISDLALEARGPGKERGVAEGAIDAAQVQRAHYMARGEGSHVFFVAINVHDRVRRDVLAAAAGKNVIARGRVGFRQLCRRDLESVLNR